MAICPASFQIKNLPCNIDIKGGWAVSWDISRFSKTHMLHLPQAREKSQCDFKKKSEQDLINDYALT